MGLRPPQTRHEVQLNRSHKCCMLCFPLPPPLYTCSSVLASANGQQFNGEISLECLFIVCECVFFFIRNLLYFTFYCVCCFTEIEHLPAAGVKTQTTTYYAVKCLQADISLYMYIYDPHLCLNASDAAHQFTMAVADFYWCHRHMPVDGVGGGAVAIARFMPLCVASSVFNVAQKSLYWHQVTVIFPKYI